MTTACTTWLQTFGDVYNFYLSPNVSKIISVIASPVGDVFYVTFIPRS